MNKSVVSIRDTNPPLHQHHHFSLVAVFSIIFKWPCDDYLRLCPIHQFPSIMFHDLILCIGLFQSQLLIAVPCSKQ
jgi:hypothetical protein